MSRFDRFLSILATFHGIEAQLFRAGRSLKNNNNNNNLPYFIQDSLFSKYNNAIAKGPVKTKVCKVKICFSNEFG